MPKKKIKRSNRMYCNRKELRTPIVTFAKETERKKYDALKKVAF